MNRTHGEVLRGGGGEGGGAGLAHDAVQADRFDESPRGVGKQLKFTVSHMYRIGVGGGGGGGGPGHVKHVVPLPVGAPELALQSNEPVDQPLTGRLFGPG